MKEKILLGANISKDILSAIITDDFNRVYLSVIEEQDTDNDHLEEDRRVSLKMDIYNKSKDGKETHKGTIVLKGSDRYDWRSLKMFINKLNEMEGINL